MGVVMAATTQQSIFFTFGHAALQECFVVNYVVVVCHPDLDVATNPLGLTAPPRSHRRSPIDSTPMLTRESSKLPRLRFDSQVDSSAAVAAAVAAARSENSYYSRGAKRWKTESQEKNRHRGSMVSLTT